jgi:cold shock CspA family protein
MRIWLSGGWRFPETPARKRAPHRTQKSACEARRRYPSSRRETSLGFIQPDNGGKDVFVHISAVERAGLSTFNEGTKVSYEEKDKSGQNVRGKSESRLAKAAAD